MKSLNIPNDAEPIVITNQIQRNFSAWIQDGVKWIPSKQTVPEISTGFYKIQYSPDLGYYLETINTISDELYDLQSPDVIDIITDIENFLSSRQIYQQLNLTYKRGYLLYGEPGNGKTCIMQLAARKAIDKFNSIVITINDEDDLSNLMSILPRIRQVEPDRNIILLIEDIDGIADDSKYVVSQLLNLLDGVKQINNIICMASTNYIEKLEGRIQSRPSRFDKKIKILEPSDDLRRSYLQYKLANTQHVEHIETIIQNTKGVSMAVLKEIVLLICIQNKSVQDAITSVTALMSKSKSKTMGY